MSPRLHTIALPFLVFVAMLVSCARKPDYNGTGAAGRGGTGAGHGGASGGAGTASPGAGGNSTGGAAGSAGIGGSGAGGSSRGGAGQGGIGQGGAGQGGIGQGGAGQGGTGQGGAGQGGVGRGGAGQGGIGQGGAGQGGTGQAGAGTAGAGGVIGPGSGVLQHHNHASRDGVYVDPAMTKTAVASMHLDPTFFSPTLNGVSMAQLLYLDGVGGKPDLVFAVTKQNHVYALNATTGRAVWDVLVGPVGIRPDTVCTPGPVGIIGTPIIDGGRRIIYLDGLVAVAGADGGTVNKHLVFALDADTGIVRSGWPVDVDAKARVGTLAFDSSVQNQRGALALLNGRLYVPYGGFGGDCGAYHGWVVGIATQDPTQVSAWATRSVLSGIWGPGGVVSDGTSLYVTTGNAAIDATWADSEAVIKLPPSLVPSNLTTDYYAPLNWNDLDRTDKDLGGTAPLLVDVPGATPSALVVALGKDQRAYVLDRANLGGIADPMIGALVSAEGIITAPATYKTPLGTFVTFRGFGNACPILEQGHTSVFTITPTAPPTLKMVWCGGPKSVTAPAVSMTDASGSNPIIWMVGTEGLLHGHDGETGAEIFAGGTDTLSNVMKYQSAIVAHGRVFVVGDRVYAFAPR